MLTVIHNIQTSEDKLAQYNNTILTDGKIIQSLGNISKRSDELMSEYENINK